MEYVNELYKLGANSDNSQISVPAEDVITLAKLLKPFAPHLASEILEKYNTDDVWPIWDEASLATDTVEYVVQVNGKLRAKLSLPADFSATELEEKALAEPNVKKYLSGTPRKVIIPKDAHLINIVP